MAAAATVAAYEGEEGSPARRESVRQIAFANPRTVSSAPSAVCQLSCGSQAGSLKKENSELKKQVRRLKAQLKALEQAQDAGKGQGRLARKIHHHKRQLVVHGIGGKYENEESLGEMFEQFGEVNQVTIRHRQGPLGNNTSWAIITMVEESAAAAALAGGEQQWLPHHNLSARSLTQSVAANSRERQAAHGRGLRREPCRGLYRSHGHSGAEPGSW